VKHSAKAVAKLAREREKQARRAAQAESASREAAAQGPSVPAAANAVGTPEAANGVGAPAAANGVGAPVAAPAASPAAAMTAKNRAGTRRMAQLPYAVVLAGILLGLGIMRGGAQDVRGGTLVMAGALLAGAMTRLVLPVGRIGLLGSRRRLLDAAALTTLGVGLLIAGLIVKVPG
jgi:hypothetical protein